MAPEKLVLLGLIALFVALEIRYTRFFRKARQTVADAIVEGVSAGSLILLIQPTVFVAGIGLGALLLPEQRGVLAEVSPLLVFGLFLIFDDLTQYAWHRLSHTLPWLYRLHRPHHNAEYLSVRVVYRNNLFYYALMPGLWLSGVLVFLGGGMVYAIYLPLKMAVILGAHSDVRWDERLYRIPALAPVMWVVERVISTPATHSAHHGKHADDGVTHYKGNYGNLLFLWDVLFGTAKITRRYPERFGVEDLPETSIGEQLFWPIVSAADARPETSTTHQPNA